MNNRDTKHNKKSHQAVFSRQNNPSVNAVLCISLTALEDEHQAFFFIPRAALERAMMAPRFLCLIMILFGCEPLLLLPHPPPLIPNREMTGIGASNVGRV